MVRLVDFVNQTYLFSDKLLGVGDNHLLRTTVVKNWSRALYFVLFFYHSMVVAFAGHLEWHQILLNNASQLRLNNGFQDTLSLMPNLIHYWLQSKTQTLLDSWWGRALERRVKFTQTTRFTTDFSGPGVIILFCLILCMPFFYPYGSNNSKVSGTQAVELDIEL